MRDPPPSPCVIPTEEPPGGDEWRNPLKWEARGGPQRPAGGPRRSLDSLRSLEMTGLVGGGLTPEGFDP